MVKKNPDNFTILGLDPGTTKGYAVLDLKGNILSVKSLKNTTFKDSIELASNFGKPLIIGSDVRPAPKYVEKIASSFGAKLTIPRKNLSRLEKSKLIKKYLRNKELKLKDKHQKDALLAAIIAHRSCKKLFDKIDNKLKEINKEYLSNQVKVKALKNRTPIKEILRTI